VPQRSPPYFCDECEQFKFALQEPDCEKIIGAPLMLLPPGGARLEAMLKRLIQNTLRAAGWELVLYPTPDRAGFRNMKDSDLHSLWLPSLRLAPPAERSGDTLR
jgi:hypothetical protein